MKILKLLGLFVAVFVFLFFTPSSYAVTGAAHVSFSSETPQVPAGKNMTVSVIVDSTVPINAVQLNIAYPSGTFKLLSIDSSNSQYNIKAQETQSPGLITIARGSLQPRTGSSLVTVLQLQAITAGSIDDFVLSPNDSLVMSSDKNENILTGSQVKTVKPPSLSPTSSAPGFISKIVKSSPISNVVDSNSLSLGSFVSFVIHLAQGSIQRLFTFR